MTTTIKTPRTRLNIKPTHSLRRVGKTIERVLNRRGLAAEEYFTTNVDYREEGCASYKFPCGITFDKMRSEGRWLAVFVVNGGSEGYYVHVDLIIQKGREESRQNVFLVKGYNFDRSMAQVVAISTLLRDYL